MRDRTHMTVVFEVKDKDAMRQLWEAHKSGTLVCGMSPNILSWGDQITAPGDIVDRLINIDPDYPDKKELREICDMAERHVIGEPTPNQANTDK